MPKEDKYFFVTSPGSTSYLPEVVKWNSDYTVQVEENVDHRQYIEVTVNKLGQKDMIKLKSDKFTKVKPIIQEIFYDHYKLALKYVSETSIEEGEYYISKRSKDWFEVMYFSGDGQKQKNITIDFRDSIEMLWLMFTCDNTFKRRAGARKNATPIPGEVFKQFLNLTLQYFYDADSVVVHLGDYLRNFKKLCDGDTNIEGFIISAEKTLELITTQLELRKEYLEKRLIENDSDTVNDRLKLRGELEGIQYSIKVVKTSI